jgi:4'-phosphopantetheinyl transferase EntD
MTDLTDFQLEVTRLFFSLAGVARRTLCTNLRFIGRRMVPHLYPAGAATAPGTRQGPVWPAEVVGYLAMADAQPTAERRMRAARQWRC